MQSPALDYQMSVGVYTDIRTIWMSLPGRAPHLCRQQRLTGSMTVKRSVIVPPRCGATGLVVKDETVEARLERAKGYPYKRPPSSFVFINGSAYALAERWTSPEQLLELTVYPASLAGNASADASNGNAQHAAAAGPSMSVAEAAEWHGIDVGALLPPDTPFTPVLAIGSNAAPSQLARKFTAEACPEGAIIPVIEATLEGFDVVYAPLISSYGSVTATLEACPGSSVSVFITYLTPPLQARMHETEGAYNLCRLDDIRLHEGSSLRQPGSAVRMLTSVFQYNHQHGCLHLPALHSSGTAASPVALAEIPATGRTFPALTQVQMQMAVRHALDGKGAVPADAASNTHLQLGGDGAPALGSDLVASGLPMGCSCEEAHTTSSSSRPAAMAAGLLPLQLPGPSGFDHAGSGELMDWVSHDGLDEWILSNLTSPEARKARVARLAAAARPFSYDKSEVLMAIGNMFSANVK